jgi:lipase chaperone LimK
MGSESSGGGGRARSVLVLGAVVALAFGVRHLRAEATTPATAPLSTRPVPTAPEKTPSAPKPAPLKATSAGEATPDSANPASLRGTDEDGALRVDENGNLVVGPEILAFFDYHLSATGEVSAAVLRARILARIHKSLPERAAGQASTLLDRYLAYREATRHLREDGDSTARLDALHRLRQKTFGEEDALRLFGDQERTDAVALAGQKVNQDPTLTPEERVARLAKLEEGLPESVRASRARAALPVRELEEEASRKAAGADAEEIRSYRVATVGEAAANRLEALDAERDEWKKRLSAYQAARAKIAEDNRDPEARKAAETRLLEASFTPQEQLRVKALDEIAAGTPPSE